jgi:hypothetical protein
MSNNTDNSRKHRPLWEFVVYVFCILGIMAVAKIPDLLSDICDSCYTGNAKVFLHVANGE